MRVNKVILGFKGLFIYFILFFVVNSLGTSLLALILFLLEICILKVLKKKCIAQILLHEARNEVVAFIKLRIK